MRTLIVDERGSLSVQEIPEPAYGECQALVKMLSCGVCNGTERHVGGIYLPVCGGVS